MAITFFNAKLAEISVGIGCPSPETRGLFADYITDSPCRFSVSVDDSDIDAEARADTAREAEITGGTPIYEFSAIQRKIAEVFPFYDRFVIHGAAITYRQDAFLFCAPSGTGKSTHISLWKRYLRADTDIINGDKPFLSLDAPPLSDGLNRQASGFRVHGSPWSGKERWQKNRSAPLRAVCFLSQADENSISRLQPDGATAMLLRQIYMPSDFEAAVKTLDLIDRLVRSVPLYHLHCNISKDAVRCSFEALTGERYPS